jgi:hypothetical protein
MEAAMGLASVARKAFGRPELHPQHLRKARPLRNPAVRQEAGSDGAVLLVAPLAQSRGMLAMLARWSKAPQTRQFELEPIGALVWELCDGRHTFETISRRLRDTYKMNRLESDAALAAFLEMLSRRRLVTLFVEERR